MASNNVGGSAVLPALRGSGAAVDLNTEIDQERVKSVRPLAWRTPKGLDELARTCAQIAGFVTPPPASWRTTA